MKAVGYKKSLPVEDADSLIDFETAKPEPKGRDIRVAVKAISANPVDYKVRKRAAPPEGETKILGYDAAGIVDAVGPDVTLFKAGRRSVLRRLDPAPGHEFGISSGRRTDRRPQAEITVVRAGRGAAADLDHRLGIAVRPAWRCAGQERRSAHASDHRRRRWRRFDPDPARAPPHRADGRRHRHAAGVRKNGASTSARMP